MYQQPAAPQLIGGVLDDAFNLLRASFSQVIGLAIVGNVVSSLWRLFDDSFDSIFAGTFDAGEGPGWNLLPMLVCALAGLYFSLSVAARMAAVAVARPITASEALRRALLRYPALLLCLGAYIALPLASVLPMVVLLDLLGVGGGSPPLIVATVLLALVPAFVLLVYWYFAIFLLVVRNIGGVRALRLSFRLVRRNWWRTVAVLTVAYFVFLAVLLLVSIVAAAVGALASFGNISADATVFVIESVGGALTTPFMVAVSLAMLRDLDLRRGGSDLARRIRDVR